jgi:SAM-dependent methyltransferase
VEYVDMDEIYRSLPREGIPWNREEPPGILVDLVESGRVRPCDAVDLGCGLGNYAIYLAGKGFSVTGIDISPTAVMMAEKNAEMKGVKCRFVVADVLGELAEFFDGFDFAWDWELLHHIFPQDRDRYVRNVHSMLRRNGQYLSVCFSGEDTHFGGEGKFRRTHIGTVLYFSSEDELGKLFEPYFKILELKTVQVGGPPAPHQAVCAFMSKK